MSTMLDELMMCHGAISLETVGSTNHSSFDQHSIQTLRSYSNLYKASNLRPSLESQLDNFACNHNSPPPQSFLASSYGTDEGESRVGAEGTEATP